MTARILDDLAHARSIMVIAPHQDDEILGAGFLMQALTRDAKMLTVVWLTDGGAAHGPLPDDRRAALVAQREDEARAGLRAMGIECDTVFLRQRDGALSEPGASDAATEALRAMIAARGVDAVFVTDRDDNHPDHRAAFAIAETLPVPVLYTYCVSATYDGAALASRGTMLRMSGGNPATKRRALACHASQRAENGAPFPLTEAAIDRFCQSPEHFYPVRRHA